MVAWDCPNGFGLVTECSGGNNKEEWCSITAAAMGMMFWI